MSLFSTPFDGAREAALVTGAGNAHELPCNCDLPHSNALPRKMKRGADHSAPRSFDFNSAYGEPDRAQL